MSDNKTAFGLSAVILAAGLLAAAFALGGRFKDLRQPGVITVKGLAEARHHATVGTWKVGVKVWGQDYAEARAKSTKQKERLKAFLKEHGFDTDSYQSESIAIDAHTEYYTDAKGERQSRENGYDAEHTIVVSTKELDKLKTALAAIQDLRAEEFAKTGNAKVGAMQSASQGSFDIQSPNPSSEDNSDYGGSYDTSTVEKNVRLVVTIQYGID